MTTYCAVRTERYLYAEYRDGSSELYDLRRDPYQLESRDDPVLAASLSARLDELCDPPPPDVPPIPRAHAEPPGGSQRVAIQVALGAVAIGSSAVLVFRRRRNGRAATS